MKKIKDFIYDKNDVIIAVAILVLAAIIITWRVDVILDYPKQLLGSGEGDGIQIEEPIKPDQGDTAGDADQDADQDADAGQDTDKDTTPVAPASLWVDGKLTKSVEVDVEGNSASAAVQCLIDKDLFEDYAEYQKLCDDNGLNHEKVSAGTFTFEVGTTKLEVAKKINWS